MSSSIKKNLPIVDKLKDFSSVKNDLALIKKQNLNHNKLLLNDSNTYD